MTDLTVVGAGLAGSEAAWQLAKAGLEVTLVEMKPQKRTPAHTADTFGELVCSNSLRSGELSTGPGLLKEELRRMGSLIMECADANRVPAGGALAVDRVGFSRDITERILAEKRIRVESREVTEIPEGTVILASGPLTSDALAQAIVRRTGSEGLHFFDAAAPIVTLESIDRTKAFFGSRYGKGSEDYINCPMNREQYLAFRQELASAEEAPVHGFEDSAVFEGCMPVEVMARRGEDTLRYGPMKPVGLRDPETDREYYAVVQLRQDNSDGTLYNLVGFQTHLRFGEQQRVFRMIPGLENAEFVRYGVMHRNTYLDSPRLLDRYYRLKAEPRIRFAGQMTGVEGYIESTASGLLAGIETARELLGKAPLDLPPQTAIGALAAYVSNETVTDFQPMNINFGLLPPLDKRVKGKQNKKLELSRRALEALQSSLEAAE